MYNISWWVLFSLDGNDSKQLDIIVTDSGCIQYNMPNPDGNGKSFSCIDGTIAAISMKSFLDKNELFDSLQNVASIPQATPLSPENCAPFVSLEGLDDGLLKVIVAMDGITPETCEKRFVEFYTSHSEIPLNRRPNYIYVVGKYCWIKVRKPLENDDGVTPEPGTLCLRTLKPDMYFICELLLSIEKINRIMRFLFFDFTPMYAKLSPKKSFENSLLPTNDPGRP